MRRISWIDQRIRNDHDKGDVAVPAMPGAGLVMIEAEFILGGLKTILDSPGARPLHVGRGVVPGAPLDRIDGAQEHPGRAEG
jgi:hypothetical protein